MIESMSMKRQCGRGDIDRLRNFVGPSKSKESIGHTYILKLFRIDET